jgi:hypothetical protein
MYLCLSRRFEKSCYCILPISRARMGLSPPGKRDKCDWTIKSFDRVDERWGPDDVQGGVSISSSSQHYRGNEAYIVICMYARVRMQSLTLIERVVVKIFGRKVGRGRCVGQG